jgi:hypothetical protein
MGCTLQPSILPLKVKVKEKLLIQAIKPFWRRQPHAAYLTPQHHA